MESQVYLRCALSTSKLQLSTLLPHSSHSIFFRMNGTPSTYLSSFFPSPTRLAFSRGAPLTDVSPSTRSFRDWNAGILSSTLPPWPPAQVPYVSAPASIPQSIAPKRNPRRAARDKGTEGGAKNTRSTSSISPDKRVRNRNNVLIECKPCKGVT